MSKTLKYIAYDAPLAEEIVMFSPMISHENMATMMGLTEVLGAGFVRMSESGELMCYGSSFTLQVKSRPEDTDLLKRMLQD